MKDYMWLLRLVQWIKTNKTPQQKFWSARTPTLKALVKHLGQVITEKTLAAQFNAWEMNNRDPDEALPIPQTICLTCQVQKTFYSYFTCPACCQHEDRCERDLNCCSDCGETLGN